MNGAHVLSSKGLKYSYDLKYSDTFDIEFAPYNQADFDN